MRKDCHYKTKKEIWMSKLTYNCIHNFNDDEKISKNKVPNSWERRGAFKKRLAPCHKGMGPKLNFGINNFQGELSKHFYFFLFFFTQKQI